MKNLAKLLGIVGNTEDNAVFNEKDTAGNNEQVLVVNIDSIIPNPYQPRKTFDDEALKDLAESIKNFGIIQPLIVRRSNDKFELIAGERRLRASKLAGLLVVPVIVKEYNNQEAAELAMIENLQREDLHFLEEAEGFQLLLSEFGLTQEELAQRVGKNQSTIANKLRLLKLDNEVRKVIIDNKLTERHARALLKIEGSTAQLNILKTVIERGLNVRETEQLIQENVEEISREMSKKSPKQNIVKVIKDVRIFMNSINKVVADLKKTGIKVKYSQNQDDDYIIINMRIPKHK